MKEALKIVDCLLEQGGNYVAERREDGVLLRATSAKANDRASFDQLARRIERALGAVLVVERLAVAELEGLIVRTGASPRVDAKLSE